MAKLKVSGMDDSTWVDEGPGKTRKAIRRLWGALGLWDGMEKESQKDVEGFSIRVCMYLLSADCKVLCVCTMDGSVLPQ